MKKQTLLILTTSLLMFASCTDEPDENKNNDEATANNEQVEADEEGTEEKDSDLEEVDNYSLQGQWDDIVYQIESGNIDNLEMYLDYDAPTFSEEEWNYIDFSAPEYAEAFAAYDSFDELPKAEYFAPGARVVTVTFEYDAGEGEFFESACMIYVVNDNGLLWIIGSEMAG
ncbi:hypothetical protein [Parvicella tangerina]|uniref:Uncharacterized protein n=1 Tax=Parvicella tangerina TaxID=2829795 RepID=A0A916JQR8_9FLAO|nr:hypothetical protein [Parvicella tangerina]CAG5086384.1 hypothetical protein CRYO30217_03103 [Parvicella tangerina]